MAASTSPRRPYGPFKARPSYPRAPEQVAELKIANAGIRVSPFVGPPRRLVGRIKQRLVCSQDIVREFIETFHDPGCRLPVYTGGFLRILSEQVPNEASRVGLASETDRFGLQRVTLDWRFTDIDKRTLSETLTLFGKYLAKVEVGNAKLVDWVWDDTLSVPGVGEDDWYGAGYHHMGTTRMAETAAHGVVDRDCRCFGTDNLFIAGSSVFPTGGQANPTLSIVQLTLRLGDHIDRSLSV